MFGAIVALIVRSERKDRRAKRQIGQALGLAPVEPDPEFVWRLTPLYRGLRAGGDIFTLSRVDTFAESATEETMRERIDQARTLLSIFTS